jgi:hypothetical protein
MIAPNRCITARAAVIALLAATAAFSAAAQEFRPTRPIEFVVHTGPGGGNDLLARAISGIVEKERLLPVRMQVTNKTWKKYLEDNLFEDGFQTTAELLKFTDQARSVLKDAGVKIYRLQLRSSQGG